VTRNIAVIPARGGSKRLPRKNILPFFGRPIIRYTIEAAQRCGLFGTVIVSTEDAEIESNIKDSGCSIHRRKPELATDTARVVHVLKNLLETELEQGNSFDYLCCLYPTAPLRDEEDVRKAYELLTARKADYCLGVTEYDFSPFFAFNMDDLGRLERRWPELAVLPPWEKPRVVVDNGSMYWVKVAAFMRRGELEGENAVGYMMPRWKSVDIDTMEDFHLAQYFARKYVSDRFGSPNPA